MKIKRLELSGFKSFVDRTVVKFDRAVMGIVGPNGCGKSNIVDAIRWCMGEQSAKNLRGRSMDDVIFSGSESRPGAEFAEVTLTFENDNDGADLPIEYKDYAEIAITRRLHRSGESEYLINKTQVRLKDVTDLFLGTGVGTKAYSIIEQGKIGLIVSAKAEDRRLLIEEAAGITKFKSKRKQAEKKMEMTQQNLLRVGDIISEIDRNLGSLKRQAAKAERYVAYRGELEDLQLHEASHRYLELTGWVKLESAEVEAHTLAHDQARAALTAREADLEGARLDAHGAEAALEVATTTNFAAENAVRAEEAAISRARDRIAALARREAEAEAELASVGAQREALGKELEHVSTELDALREQEAEQAEQAEDEGARLAEIVAEQERANRNVAEHRQRVAQTQAQIASGEAKLEGFERRKSETTQRHEKRVLERAELEYAAAELAARVDVLTAEVSGTREGKLLSSEEKAALETRLAELRHDIVASERLLDEAKHDAQKKRSRLHALVEIQAKLEGVGAGTKALIGSKDPTVLGLLADRVEAEASATAALAGWLGTRLLDVVVKDPARAEALLDDLRRSKKGRATVVPHRPARVAGQATRAPLQIQGVVGHLVDFVHFSSDDEELVRAVVGDVVLVESDEAAREVLAHTRLAAVTRAGTVHYPDGRVAGGTGEDVVAHMLDSRRECRELGHEVEVLERVLTERLAAHQALRLALTETQSALDIARQRAHEGELALVRVEKDLRAAEAEQTASRGRAEALAREIDELAWQLSQAVEERDLAAGMLDEARAELDVAQRELEDAEAFALSWTEQVDARRAHVTERRVRVAGTREKLHAARGTVSRLEKSTLELAEREGRLDRQLADGAREHGETAAQLYLHTETLRSALDAAREAEDTLLGARATFEAVRQGLSEREAELRALRASADAARESLTAHEMNLRERALALRHLLEAIAEKFRGLALARVVGDYHLRPPPDEALRARIAELTGLIERMGSVNLDAMREHEEAEKRFSFYSDQKADLDAALADLTRAIEQMNRESKKLFEETYTQVNARFQEIFPRMFRGGRASLRLTNPDDMLETGIEILAQPPGKKLASIELMSGGEKALTAVSLIFAIFQIKPSPFCILDEVDAPLDEANVARYNEMVRSMTDRSQFILITHIKRTMQMVDVLHGVTMQESGVSRLVTVTLNEAAERRPGEHGASAAVA
ncbi:MAG TPA: chromosome segregation protein SMC [Polyangiaceae bacterium]|nr:chromosome segregation protein SMC [Polyangiaceae bacterium]